MPPAMQPLNRTGLEKDRIQELLVWTLGYFYITTIDSVVQLLDNLRRVNKSTPLLQLLLSEHRPRLWPRLCKQSFVRATDHVNVYFVVRCKRRLPPFQRPVSCRGGMSKVCERCPRAALSLRQSKVRPVRVEWEVVDVVMREVVELICEVGRVDDSIARFVQICEWVCQHCLVLVPEVHTIASLCYSLAVVYRLAGEKNIAENSSSSEQLR